MAGKHRLQMVVHKSECRVVLGRNGEQRFGGPGSLVLSTHGRAEQAQSDALPSKRGGHVERAELNGLGSEAMRNYPALNFLICP